MTDAVEDFDKQMNSLIDEEEDIDNLLMFWEENSKVKKLSEKRDEKLKTKIKIYLKERKWKKYRDDKSNISVSISMLKREVIDKEQLKLILNESQIAQVINTKSFERMSIITPEARKRLKQYVSKK